MTVIIMRIIALFVVYLFLCRMSDDANEPTEEMVSFYITSTCQLLPKSFPIVTDKMHNLIPPGCSNPKTYSILSGSNAEFYIQPLLTCIGDNDFLICEVDEMAFTTNVPVLPRDIRGLPESIRCFKIEPYQRYPGFVRLRGLGTTNYDWEYKKYDRDHAHFSDCYKKRNVALSSDQVLCTRIINNSQTSSMGPAIKYHSYADCCLGVDIVESVWCPQWPSEAQDWPNRPRNYGWPTVATISDVVQQGCHAVYVQHRACREDEYQCRLSFSVAEVILLQSWTQIQQIVYHLLRFFAKRELIKDCPKEDEVLCMYHLKTLMLWTCEEMPPEYWDSASVITICCELLQKLSLWLRRKNCPNYFIPEANLFHESLNPTKLEETKSRLQQFSAAHVLCRWFVENYIQPFIITYFKCNADITISHLKQSMGHVFESRKANELSSLDVLFSTRFLYSHKEFRCNIEKAGRADTRHILKLKCHTTKLHSERYQLTTILNVLCFMYYDTLLSLSHLAHGLGSREISWESSFVVDLVKTISMQPTIIRSAYHNFPKPHKERIHRYLFHRALALMENLTGSNSLSESQLLSFISNELLRKTLEAGCPTCPEGKGIASAVLAYLAALGFAATKHETAIGFCLEVLNYQTSTDKKETLNAVCLLFIDDVARIAGLCLLYKKLTDREGLKYINKRLYLDLRVSPDVFAHHMIALSAERKSTDMNFHYDLPVSLFPMDEYLKSLTKSKCIAWMKADGSIQFNANKKIACRRRDALADTASTIVNPFIEKESAISILMECALENMTTFFSVLDKDFGIQCNTSDCYRALYLYKSHKYDEMMNLCQKILHEPDLQSDLKEFGFANVLVLPPLDTFFDRDVQSLLGFHTLFSYLSHQNYDAPEPNPKDLTFANYFGHRVCFLNHALSKCLEEQYSIKYHYFLGRHFLARYLKVKYCIDCDLDYTVSLAEFAKQEVTLPFEQIIRSFILSRLHICKPQFISF